MIEKKGDMEYTEIHSVRESSMKIEQANQGGYELTQCTVYGLMNRNTES